MIRFLDSSRSPQPPAFLRGATELQQRQSRNGTLWGCGDVYELDESGEWTALSETLSVAGPVDGHARYLRRTPWVRTVEVTDINGISWMAPRILDKAGERVFSVSYGIDFLPRLTPEQYRAMDIAKAARDALVAASAGTQDVDMALAARWAAELLAIPYHFPVEAIAALGILDDAIIPGALHVATDLRLEVIR